MACIVRFKKAILVALLCTLFNIPVLSSTFSSYSFNSTTGFKRTNVYDIVKDRTGVYWLGTEKGVVCFDGANFIEFYNTIPKAGNEEVVRLRLFQNDLFVIYRSNGFGRLNLKTFTFERFNINAVADVMQKGADTLFVLTLDGKLIRLKDKVRESEITLNNFTSEGKLVFFKGDLFAGIHNEGVIQIDPDKFVIKDKLIDSVGSSLLNLEVVNDSLFVIANGKVFHLNSSEKLFLEKKTFIDDQYHVCKLSSTGNGNYAFIYNDNNFATIRNGVMNVFPQRDFGRTQIHCFRYDLNIGYLIGTNQGLSICKESNSKITHIYNNTLPNDSQVFIPSRIIECDSAKWLLLGRGFSIDYNPLINSSKIILDDLNITDACIVSKNVYLLTEGKGVFIYNNESGKFEKFDLGKYNFKTFYSVTYDIQEDKLYIGGLGYVLEYSFKENQVKELIRDLPQTPIVCLQKDIFSNLLYIGSNSIVFQLSLSIGQLKSVFKNDEATISDFKLIDSAKKLWIAHSKGADVIDCEKAQTKLVLSTDVIDDPETGTLLVDDADRLWTASFSGIIVYDIKKNLYIKLSQKSGLINTEYKNKAACKLADGRLIFGGTNGYDILDPSYYNVSTGKTRGRITGYYNVSVEDTTFNLLRSSELKFNPETDIIRLYVTNGSNFNSHLSTFEYRLNRGSWLKASGSGEIVLFNLQPDIYDLEIRGFDNEGNYIKFPPIKVNAEIPFLHRPLFIWSVFLLVIILIGLVILILFYKRYSTDKLREELSMDLHDEIGTVLTRAVFLINDQDCDKYKDEIAQYLSDALFGLRLYANTIHRDKISLYEIQDEIRELAIKTFPSAAYKLDFDFDLDKNYKLKGTIVRDLRLSIYEVFSNILRHSDANCVSFKMHAKEGILSVRVKDNGSKECLKKIKLGTGNGVKNIFKRINRNNGTVSYIVTEETPGLIVKMSFKV